MGTSKRKAHTMNSPVAKNLKNLREARGWTQEHLAAIADVRVRTVQRAESGHPLAAESLQALAAAFSVGVEDLRRDHDAEAVAAYLERFERVGVRQVETGAVLFSLISQAKALLVRPSSDALAVRVVRELAEVETFMAELLDLVGDAPPTYLLEALAELNPILSRLQSAGLFVSAGVCRAPFGTVELDTLLIFISDARAEYVFVERPNRKAKKTDVAPGN
jgi:transcriptional regulator with XRE-family HTH domain